MSTTARHGSAYVMVVVTAALFSTGGAAIKMSELSSWQIAAGRSGIAALVLFLLAPGGRRGWSARTVAVGVAYAATMILFVHANKLTTAANTIFLQATAPLYVLVLAPVLLHEPLRRRDLLFLLAFGTGLAAFFVTSEAPAATASDPVLGNLLAAASGFTYALTIIGLRAGERGDEAGGGRANSAVVCGNTFACLGALPFALGAGPSWGAVSGTDLLVVSYLGLVQVALAYLVLNLALRYLTALETSVLLLVEPTLSPIWAFLLHGERPGGWAVAGGAVILGATALRATLESRRRRPAGA